MARPGCPSARSPPSLAVWVIGNAHVDDGNTSRNAGFTLEGNEFDRSLSPGLFTADPNQPGHDILSSLLPVPEPATVGLWLAGLAGLLLGAKRRLDRISPDRAVAHPPRLF